MRQLKRIWKLLLIAIGGAVLYGGCLVFENGGFSVI